MIDQPVPADIDSPESLRRAALNLLNASSPGRARIRDVHDRMCRAADVIEGLRDEVERLRREVEQPTEAYGDPQ